MIIRFLFLFFILFSAAQVRGQNNNVINGILNYSGQESVELNGEWRFYWNKLYQDYPLLDQTSKPAIVDCPALWDTYKINAEGLPAFGFATYSLTIQADRAYPETALELPGFYTAYNLYFNGVRIAGKGTVGKSPETSVLGWLPQSIPIKLKRGNNKLHIEVSNFHHSKGGFVADITLGESDYLFSRRENQVMIDMFSIGCYFIVGLFLLSSYWFWNKDKALLFCALFSLSYSLRLGLFELHLFNQVFSNISPWVSIELAYLAFYSSWLFFVLFFSVVFKEDFIKGVKEIMLIVSGIVMLATIILPLEYYSLLVGPYTYFGVLISLPCLFIIIKAVINKRQGAVLAACSIFVMVLALAFTFLQYHNWFKHQYILNFIFLLAYVFVILVVAQRFAMAFHTVEELQFESVKKKEIQSRWFANIAHELLTPLTLIEGPINNILKNYKQKKPVKQQDILHAKKNSENLMSLVHEILDITKLETQAVTIENSPTDIGDLIQETLATFSALTEQKNVTVTAEISKYLILDIDKNKIAKVVANLFSNAQKFTKKDGNIKVGVEVNSTTVRISVSDDGEGILAQEIPMIFDRYYQVDRGHDTNYGGMGIGLSLALELAELHGGTITVESEPSQGSTFALELPASLVVESYETKVQTQLKSKTAPTSWMQSTKATKTEDIILVVEDHPDMRSYVVQLLNEEYKVIEAVDGSDALNILKTTVPDLIVSDMMMSPMDGYQFIKELKSEDKYHSIPFIALTARVAEGDKISTLRLGIDDYVTKPFNPEELQIRIKVLLTNLRERRQFAEKKEVQAPSHDETLIFKFQNKIKTELKNSGFGVRDLVEFANMSESSLTRFMKKNIGITSGQFIREVRLHEALSMLEQNQFTTIKEVVYSAGFESPSHFSKVFYERFGKRPSEYLNK